MKEFLEEILVENADMSLHGKVQEYLQSIMEVDFRTSGSEENIKRSYYENIRNPDELFKQNVFQK